MSSKTKSAESARTRSQVRSAYAQVARRGGSCCGSSPCGCGPSAADALAQGVGYSAEELSALPDGANLGLSCGNPTALASLRRGETVLDLGAGGGFDVFIAARRVGPRGRAIGVDMTPEMLDRARRNAEAFRKDTGWNNVEFRLGEIEHLPAGDATVDVILSNCVVNLSTDKPQVWREAFRVLKPGGRVAVSDLALLRPIPEELRKSLDAYVGCVGGAALVRDTGKWLRAAGFTGIVLESDPGKVEALTQGTDFGRKIARLLPKRRKAGDYVTSLSISARKRAR